MSAGEIRRVILHNRTSKKTVGEKKEETACHLFALIQDRTREWMEVVACVCVDVYACVCLGVEGIHVLPFDSGPVCLVGERRKNRIWGRFLN